MRARTFEKIDEITGAVSRAVVDLVTDSLNTQGDRFRRSIKLLLDQVGDRGTCKGCGKTIWWIMTLSGKRAPYTDEAINHFADCPNAARFRK